MTTSRKYEQRLRAESAEETRRRILDAFADQLRHAPTEPVSLDLVARRAKVARSTIYTVFGDRAGLFDAFVADLWARTGMSELTEAVGAPDPRAHLRGGISAANRMYAQDRTVYRMLFSLGRIEGNAAGDAVSKMENERAGGMAYLARRLSESAVLREDVTVERAADMLWALCSFDTFDALYTQRGLSLEQTTNLMVAMAERAVCRPARNRR